MYIGLSCVTKYVHRTFMCYEHMLWHGTHIHEAFALASKNIGT